MQHPALTAADSMTPDALNAQARDLVMQGRFDEAEQLLQASIQKGQTATACRLLGNIYYTRRDMQGAITLFNAALKLDEHDHASMAMLAEVYFAMNDVNCAGYSIMAMSENPGDLRYKERFVHFSPKMLFTEHSPLIENAIVECLKTPGLDCANLQSLWYNMFSLSREYRAIYKTFETADPVGKQKTSGLKKLLGRSKAEPYVFFDADHFRRAKDLAPLLNPFFTLGLKSLLVCRLPFEEFLTSLRGRLLDEAPNRDLLELVAALASYAFRTGYIFPTTEAEQKKVAELRPRLEAGLPEGKEWQASIYACYAPLYRLRNAGAVAEAFASTPEMADLVRAQVFEYLTIEEIADVLPEVTPVETTAAAQAQYEEFLYPLWNARPRSMQDDGVGASLRKKGAKILIAGCGTGRGAAEAALAFPDARILAVDLSRGALAFGAMRAKEFNLSNVDFAQADILNLGAARRTFDGIVADDVLHHLPDPVQGWKALAGVLEPGGLMRVSLHSAAARENIATVREIIKKGGFTGAIEGMKAFRQDAPRLLPPDIFHDMARLEDYYQLAMYRDMLFGVQEHRFDLLQIKEILAGLGLTFLKMSVSPAILAQFRDLYPADPEGKDLDNWNDLERRAPDTFTGLYQFWCRKN